MFSCFGNVEEKPWKGVASTLQKKLRNIKKSKESPRTNNNQVPSNRNLAINHRLEHFRHYCERCYQRNYVDHRHHHPGSHIATKAHSASKFDHVESDLIKLSRKGVSEFDSVRSGLINIYGGHGFDLSEEVDIRAEEFIKNMKISWSLEKQQSSDSINSIN